MNIALVLYIYLIFLFFAAIVLLYLEKWIIKNYKKNEKLINNIEKLEDNDKL